VDRGLDKPGLGEQLEERPPPHGTGDSVRPGVFAGDLFGRYPLFEQDVAHLEPTAGAVLAGAIVFVSYALLLGSIFLLVVGAGRWSFDAVLARKVQAP
jgi:hypothetical protein